MAADAEANAPMEDVLTEEERAEVADLRGAVDGLSEKYEGVLDSLRADEVRALLRQHLSALGLIPIFCPYLQ